MLKSEKEAFNWGFEAGFLRSPVNPRMLLLNRTPEIDCAGDGNTSGNASAWSLVSIANDLLRVDLSSLFNEIASHFRERANRRFYIDLQNAMRQPPAAPHPAQHTSMDCAAEPDHDDWLDPDDPDQEPPQAELNEAEIAINLQKQKERDLDFFAPIFDKAITSHAHGEISGMARYLLENVCRQCVMNITAIPDYRYYSCWMNNNAIECDEINRLYRAVITTSGQLNKQEMASLFSSYLQLESNDMSINATNGETDLTAPVPYDRDNPIRNFPKAKSQIETACVCTNMGVRTESWTAGRSGLEVRMYSREKVELFLLATEDGMGPTAAAEFAGVSVGAAKKWATGHLPRSYTGARCRIVARKPPRKEASLGPDKSIYAPPATGPLAGLNEDQIENLLLRAVLADLKAEGWDPASISNRSKCELGERLRRATALPLRSITGFLRISKSSYEYWRPRVAAPRDRDADIRDRVVRIFREGSGCWGYRTVWARLRREGVRASEKRVARVMREEGLEVVYNKRRARGYSSYAGEVSKAPENLVNRNFHADEPNRLWLTDITEFRLPGGEKVYLSPVIDCFDGMPVAWSIGLHPDKRLANSSLLKACAARPAGARTTIHSDRGGHYRWPEWIGICEENGLVRSMSAKGCSPDNSACEGFFGRLKNEFFRYRDWEGVTAEEFMGRLEAYLVYYRDGRIKKSLEWLSPMEYRRKLGYA